MILKQLISLIIKKYLIYKKLFILNDYIYYTENKF